MCRSAFIPFLIKSLSWFREIIAEAGQNALHVRPLKLVFGVKVPNGNPFIAVELL